MQGVTKKTGLVIGTIILPALAVGMVFTAANNRIRPSKASAYTMALNQNNAPSLNNGEGTMEDEKGVTWEYYNASDNANGHVSLGHQGYFGVSASTQYGYTGIEEITVNFTKGSNGELWLLTSVNGTNWEEGVMLESGTSTDWGNNYRYVQFYYWDEDNNSANITSVSFGYKCSGINAKEDVDLAYEDNVVNSLNVTPTDETTTVSPAGGSTRALRITKDANGSNYVDLAFARPLELEEIFTRKIVFDYYHKNNSARPSVQFFNAKNSSVGTAGTYNGSKTNYKVSNLNSDWWHIEVHVDSMIALWVEKGDVASTGGPVTKIRVNTSNSVIDNFRFDSTPSTQGNLGIYNNGTSFGVNDSKPYWMKISWSGVLHSCTFTFDTPGIIQQYQSDKSPFYLDGIAAGTVVVTATLVVGYNRQTVSISNTITVNS